MSENSQPARVAGAFEKAWQSYRSAVLPSDAPAVQVTECRRAFYAGAHALRCEFLNTPDDPKQEHIALLALEMELDQFNRDVKAGLA